MLVYFLFAMTEGYLTHTTPPSSTEKEPHLVVCFNFYFSDRSVTLNISKEDPLNHIFAQMAKDKPGFVFYKENGDLDIKLEKITQKYYENILAYYAKRFSQYTIPIIKLAEILALNDLKERITSLKITPQLFQNSFLAIMDQLQTGHDYLTSIEVEHLNILGSDKKIIDHEKMTIVISTIANLPQLTRLKIISLTKMDDNIIKALAQNIKANTTLKELTLNYCMSENAIKLIGEMLEENNTLQELSLVGNKMKAEDTVVVAEALVINKSLKKLDLHYNQMGDAGAITLAAALDKNTGLTTLNLEENQIGDEGAKAVVDAIKSKPAEDFQKLDLSFNNIGEEMKKTIQSDSRIFLG